MAAREYLLLLQGQLTAGSNGKLPAHEIETRHRFRHRVLDLETGVHFEEVESSTSIQQHLHSTRVDVTAGPCRGDGHYPHSFAQFRTYSG